MKNNHSILLYKLGQTLGVSAGGITASLWMYYLWGPSTLSSFNVGSMGSVFLMIILAVIAIVASLKGHAMVLFVIFGISFLPIGLYLLGLPLWIQWIGLSNIGYLLSGLIIWRFRPLLTEEKTSPDLQE